MATEGVHANIRAIREMEEAHARFARAMLELLPQIARETRRVQEELEERASALRRDIEEAEEREDSDDEADSWEREQGLAEARETLSAIKRQIRRLGDAAAEYQKRARGAETLATDGAVRARAFLRSAADDAMAYLSSAGGVVSSHSSTVSATTETLDAMLARLGLDGSRPATADDMVALLSELEEDSPCNVDEVAAISGQPTGPLSTENLRRWTQEYLNWVPPEIVERLRLRKIEIKVTPLTRANGEYNREGTLTLSSEHLRDSWNARRVLFHELTHWLHRERKGDDPWVIAIKTHFENRTRGRKTVLIREEPPAWVAEDDWYDYYAGRIYYYKEEATHLGLEVPTSHIELLNYPPEELADAWNSRTIREALILTLKGFYTTNADS